MADIFDRLIDLGDKYVTARYINPPPARPKAPKVEPPKSITPPPVAPVVTSAPVNARDVSSPSLTGFLQSEEFSALFKNPIVLLGLGALVFFGIRAMRG